jgi:hypothetical protein
VGNVFVGIQSLPINIKSGTQIVDDLFVITSAAVKGVINSPVSFTCCSILAKSPQIFNLATITRSVVAIQPSYPIVELFEQIYFGNLNPTHCVSSHQTPRCLPRKAFSYRQCGGQPGKKADSQL